MSSPGDEMGVNPAQREGPAAPRERPLRSDARASRATLLAAARELCAERGPDALTVVAVAKRAGLNRSTAYQHFRNREELTQAVADAFDEELHALLQEPRGLEEQIDFFVHYAGQHPEIARLWMFHLLAGQNRTRQGWGHYVESLERISRGTGQQRGNDTEMLAVIGMTSTLAWSVLARQRNDDEQVARAETDRFAAELKRLVLAGTRRPE